MAKIAFIVSCVVFVLIWVSSVEDANARSFVDCGAAVRSRRTPSSTSVVSSNSNSKRRASSQIVDHGAAIRNRRTPASTSVSSNRNNITRRASNQLTSITTKENVLEQIERRRGGGSGPSRVGSASTHTDELSSKGKGKKPSFYWALLANWLYCISLCFNAINIQILIRHIVDGEDASSPSAEAIALSGRVESVDKLLTFAGIGFLSALSDKFGRKPLMAWASIGFGITNFIQASCRSGSNIALLYLADFVDGCSSCMTPLCQSYVCDVSTTAKRAANLGVFQGISVGCAFVLGFPIGGILGTKYGPRIPLLIAAALQLLNALIIIFITPESNNERLSKLDLREDNPIGGLHRLFCHSPLLRTAAMTYFLTSLGRSSLDAQFVNYSSIRFGWTQAQSGPILVLVGLMLAVAPRILVPLLGMKDSILVGLFVLAAGLTLTGLAPTPIGFALSIFVVSIGCVCIPALQALLSNLASPSERGALLGAVGSLNELTGAIGSTMYASILAKFTKTSGDKPLSSVPGMHFIVASGLLLIAWSIAFQGFVANRDHPVLKDDE